MEPQQQPAENGVKKRSFANKLGALRTYKEIPQEELAKGGILFHFVIT
jgi:hypothetical protein